MTGDSLENNSTYFFKICNKDFNVFIIIKKKPLTKALMSTDSYKNSLKRVLVRKKYPKIRNETGYLKSRLDCWVFTYMERSGIRLVPMTICLHRDHTTPHIQKHSHIFVVQLKRWPTQSSLFPQIWQPSWPSFLPPHF